MPAPHSPTARDTRRRGRGTRGGSRVWGLFALPGTAWIAAFFAVPFYAVASVAFGSTDPLFGEPIPEWNPLQWQFSTFGQVWSSGFGGDLTPVLIRTGVYVLVAVLLCSLIGYPVAYYVARLAGKRRGLLLGLILAPWWINYLTRMMAWLNLLADDGWVNRLLRATGLITGPIHWLSGNPYTVVIALVYGYIPFFIVPLFATLDRIDGRLLEASRDLGMGAARTFLRVTLPLSRPGLLTACVITALPMFGDYYTNTLVSGSPTTSMIGNQIQLYLLGGPQKDFGASLVLLLSALLTLLMAYYLHTVRRDSKEN
ncbi:ABC transporter permease [Streptacidiphilus rugosus]|uniref:ABC transporter permease n=1 Tax=Streptacidiphilus rugosus TaxID=405783 RepID=UPI000689B234|nr:ABC transporter permease [Streptacidiphilus rugosus]